MPYSVKEMFYTLQGEGARSGRASVFCRFTGCNLWTGREGDRERAVCRFCDTDFVGTDGSGGGRFATADDLAGAVSALWPSNRSDPRRSERPYVVCTGGEPLLQLDAPLIDAFHQRGFEIAIETNGTLPVPAGVDWVCVSPKAGSDIVVRRGNELKLIYPQRGAEPERFSNWSFEYFYLQPMDLEPIRDRIPVESLLQGPLLQGRDNENFDLTQRAIEYCMSHPQWMLSLQTHKMLGIP